MLIRIWNSGNSPTLLVKMQDDTTTLQDSLVVSYQTKYSLTTQSNNHTSWYLPPKAENLCPQNIFTSTFTIVNHNCQNLEAANIPFSK